MVISCQLYLVKCGSSCLILYKLSVDSWISWSEHGSRPNDEYNKMTLLKTKKVEVIYCWTLRSQSAN